MNKQPLIIYHANCNDGFGAALVAKIHFNHNGIEPEFVPKHYNEEIPDVQDREVYILDFSYPKLVLRVMKEGITDDTGETTRPAKSIVVLDHHQTAEKELAGLDFCHFEKDKSGAVMAWEYFFPNENIPKLILYIQDRDLWKWELPNSREVSYGLAHIGYNFDQWEKYLYNIDGLLATGKIVLEMNEKYVDNKTQKPNIIEFCGRKVPIINTTHLVSECGEALSRDYPFVVMYFDTEDKRIFSLRSCEDNKYHVDVSAIAKAFDGGGHKHAAGFSVPLAKAMLGLPDIETVTIYI